MNEHILQVADGYKQQYQKDPQAFLVSVGKFASIWGTLVLLYCELLKDNRCVHIEELPSSEKKRLWAEAGKIAIKNDDHYMKELCRALHGFEVYMNM